MKIFKNHVVLVMGPSNHAYDVSEKAGRMYLNRFCIDEEAAFEAAGVYSMQKYGTKIPYKLRYRFFWNQMKRFAESKPKDSKIHLIYTESNLFKKEDLTDQLKSFILKGMKMYKIETVIVTILRMNRNNHITQEIMKKFCQGENLRKKSVNDDLDEFFKMLQLGLEQSEDVWTYFLPKLTEKELELTAKKDSSYLQSFLLSNPDVDVAQMKLSESDSKFVQGFCWRRTFTIKVKGKFTIGSFF